MKPTCLIVNADDFGYFDGVSRGIAEAARHGIVTATGVIANAAGLERHVPWLDALVDLDVGVHLNLTWGGPLSDSMRAELGRWNGRFPGKLDLATAVLRGSITPEAVSAEWRAQIERCRSVGLEPCFLNSHEHVHMLPRLYGIVSGLAREFHIPHIRRARPEWSGRQTPASLFRNLGLGALAALREFGREARAAPAPILLGVAASGKLNMRYLDRRLETLHGGGVYELMCHPGILESGVEVEPGIVEYHDWDGEREALCSGAARELLQRHGIRLIGYRHLRIGDGVLDVVGSDERA